MMTLIGRGPRNLITDIDGLMVGCASDDALKSGVTVITGDTPFTAAVHVMGGAPGSRETDLLAPDKLVNQVDAIVLSGGSAHGLEAASGVMAALHRAGRGYMVGDQNVPIVPAAILFDLLNGGDKSWTQNPYADLGAAALANASTDITLGSHGAGVGATTATVKGGLGSASVALDKGVMVGALMAANPVGTVLCPDSNRFWGAAWECDDEYGGLGLPQPRHPFALTTKQPQGARENTVIGVVATNLALDKAALTRLAVAAHDGLARAVVPSHTPLDGDMIFAISTGQHHFTPSPLDLAALGHAAAVSVTRAISRAIWHATPSAGDILPVAKDVINAHDLSSGSSL